MIEHPKNIEGLKQIATDFGQDSILESKNGNNILHYVNGPKAGTQVTGEGYKTYNEAPEDGYSVIPTESGNVYVQHNLDFPEEKNHQEMADKLAPHIDKLDKAQIAYHGSPKDFTHFSTEFSGQHQGNARGHGIYFSSVPEGASFYSKLGSKTKTGGMYTAEIPDQKYMMHWDKPVSKQHPNIQKILRQTDAYKSANERAAKEPGRWLSGEQLKGGELYGGLQHYHDLSEEDASKYLRQKGIKGITYNHDNYSNHVVFHPDDAKIVDLPKNKINKSEDLRKDDPNHNDRLRALASDYASSKGLSINHEMPKVKVDPTHGAKIGQAYESMSHNPEDPNVKSAYHALINETGDQFKHLVNHGLKVSQIKSGQENPYKTSKDLFNDVKQNNHVWYFPTEQGFGSGGSSSDHPMLQPTEFQHEGKSMPANDIFRIVHDVYGHAKEGHAFGPNGEENAYRTHMQMYSPEAQKALTSETRGQNSAVNWGKHGAHNRANPHKTIYADQKAGLMPDWASAANEMTKKAEILQKPYRSEAQRRWAHTDAGKKALGGDTAVHEWDEAAKGKHLPEKISKEEELDKTRRDLKDAAEYASYHIAPDLAADESPKSYEKAKADVTNHIMSAPKKEITLDVNHTHQALNPADNGRRPSSKHEKNPIIIGQIGKNHVLLDGHHRLINAKEKGHKKIQAHIIQLPKTFSSLLDVDHGVGKLKKSEESSSPIDLDKGQNGDWKKEGYKISHKGTLSDDLEIHAHDINGKHVGSALIDRLGDHHIVSASTNVHPEHQRKGLASAMYSHAESLTGRKMKPVTDLPESKKEGNYGYQSEAGKALWSQKDKSFGKSEKADSPLDIQKGQKDIESKSLDEIQKDTAYTWASRAAAAYEKFEETKDPKWKIDAEEYRHEAVEHSSLVYDVYPEVLKEVNEKLQKYRSKTSEELEDLKRNEDDLSYFENVQLKPDQKPVSNLDRLKQIFEINHIPVLQLDGKLVDKLSSPRWKLG
jgi:predicted GNAT family acetyltransferase